MTKIVILDLGISNSTSVARMINSIGFECKIANTANDIYRENILIMPGVGHFDQGIFELKKRGFDKVLNYYKNNSTIKILGICLGMQLFFEKSDEGPSKGLGFFKGTVKKFKGNHFPKGFNIGWRSVNFIKKKGDLSLQKFYFVHGYYPECVDDKDILAISNFGSDFTCAVNKLSITAVQFHPEKSHRFGKQFLKGFINGI